MAAPRRLTLPEPPAIAKLAGALALARGVDNLQAGVRQALTDDIVETATGAAMRAAKP